MLDVNQIDWRSGWWTGHHHDLLARPWRRARATVAALLFPLLLSACGSSSSAVSSAEVKQTCGQIEAVLSDGPEPAADPVGYAQAQIRPLRQISTSDRRLHEAIYELASAYQAVSAANHVDHASDDAISAAAHRVDAICPGAAS
jgi:hypothetical protein